MSTLHLGVDDVGYSSGEGSTSTGKVADILEGRYHVMRVFYEEHEKEAAEAIALKYKILLDNLMKGKSLGNTKQLPMDSIVTSFRNFLSGDEWRKISGQRIKAAEARRTLGSSRKKMGRLPVPVAFVDSGLYSDSMRAWLDIT